MMSAKLPILLDPPLEESTSGPCYPNQVFMRSVPRIGAEQSMSLWICMQQASQELMQQLLIIGNEPCSAHLRCLKLCASTVVMLILIRWAQMQLRNGRTCSCICNAQCQQKKMYDAQGDGSGHCGSEHVPLHLSCIWADQGLQECYISIFLCLSIQEAKARDATIFRTPLTEMLSMASSHALQQTLQTRLAASNHVCMGASGTQLGSSFQSCDGCWWLQATCPATIGGWLHSPLGRAGTTTTMPSSSQPVMA